MSKKDKKDKELGIPADLPEGMKEVRRAMYCKSEPTKKAELPEPFQKWKWR